MQHFHPRTFNIFEFIMLHTQSHTQSPLYSFSHWNMGRRSMRAKPLGMKGENGTIFPSFPWCTTNSSNSTHKLQRGQEKWLGTSLLHTLGHHVEWCWMMVNDVGWSATEWFDCHNMLNSTMLNVVERKCCIRLLYSPTSDQYQFSPHHISVLWHIQAMRI